MGKMVSATEFKAKSLKLIDEMERSGEPLTITRRGKASLTLTAQKAGGTPINTIFGALAHPAYRFDDPFSPAVDPDDWDANR